MLNLRQHEDYFRENNPFYYDVLIGLRVIEEDKCPTLGVRYNKSNDSIELGINEKFFLSHDFKQQIALLIHEINHITNYHIIRGEKKERFVFNIACDIAINQYIPNLPSPCLPDKTMEWNKSTEYYYNILYKEYEKVKKEVEEMMKQFKGKWKLVDDHSQWGKNGMEAANKITSIIEKSMLKGNVSNDEQNKIENGLKDLKGESHKGNGDFSPFSWGGRSVDDMLNTIREAYGIHQRQVNWRRELKKFVFQYTKKKMRNTVKRPNSRYNIPYGRFKLHSDQPKGIIVIDVSPSIPSDLLKFFKKEVRELFNILKEVRIILVDYDIRLDKKIKSRGDEFWKKDGGYGSGTDLKTVFKKLKTEKTKGQGYNFLIYFTDLESEIPEIELAPPYPVLWALYNPNLRMNADVKFGDVLWLDRNEENRT